MSYVILDDQILVCYFGFSRPYRAIALQVKIFFLLRVFKNFGSL